MIRSAGCYGVGYRERARAPPRGISEVARARKCPSPRAIAGRCETRLVEDGDRRLRRPDGCRCRRRRGTQRDLRSVDRAFQEKRLARGITPETYARVMNGLKPDQHRACGGYPSAAAGIRTSSSGNICNRRVSIGASSPAGRKRKNTRRCWHASSATMASRPRSRSASGRGVDLRRPARAEEPHAAVIPSLATLARGEPRRRDILGGRTDQCAHRHSEWLEHARRDERLLGRRHGPYPVDAGGLVASRRRL